MLFDFRPIIQLLDQLDRIRTGLVVPHQRIKYHAEDSVQILLLLDFIQGGVRLVKGNVLLAAPFNESLIHAFGLLGLGAADVGRI